MTFCCLVTFFFKNVGIRGSLALYFSEFVFAGQCHFVATSCDRKFVPHRRARTLQPLRESTYQRIALLTCSHLVIRAPSSWLCSVTKLKGHRRKSAGLLPNDIAFEFLFFFCLCGLLVDGWMGWCWWGRWWDGRHGGGSGVRPRMRLSGRGESRFVQSSLWSGLFLPLSEIWNFLTKLPNWGDSANMFRNIPIKSLLILLI